MKLNIALTTSLTAFLVLISFPAWGQCPVVGIDPVDGTVSLELETLGNKWGGLSGEGFYMERGDLLVKGQYGDIAISWYRLADWDSKALRLGPDGINYYWYYPFTGLFEWNIPTGMLDADGNQIIYYGRWVLDDWVILNPFIPGPSEQSLGPIQMEFTECNGGLYLQIKGDYDMDGIVDYNDNCYLVKNPDQADADGDRVGDICDNCDQYNPWQEDLDGNGVGDICENEAPQPNPDEEDSEGDDLPDDSEVSEWMQYIEERFDESLGKAITAIFQEAPFLQKQFFDIVGDGDINPFEEGLDEKSRRVIALKMAAFLKRVEALPGKKLPQEVKQDILPFGYDLIAFMLESRE